MLSFASDQSEGLVSRGCSEVIPHKWPKSVPLICYLLVGKKKALNLWFQGSILLWGWMEFSKVSTNLAQLKTFFRWASYGKTPHSALSQSNGSTFCLFFEVVMDHTVAACSSTSSCFLHNLSVSLFSMQGKTIQRDVAFLPPLQLESTTSNWWRTSRSGSS